MYGGQEASYGNMIESSMIPGSTGMSPSPTILQQQHASDLYSNGGANMIASLRTHSSKFPVSRRCCTARGFPYELKSAALTVLWHIPPTDLRHIPSWFECFSCAPKKYLAYRRRHFSSFLAEWGKCLFIRVDSNAGLSISISLSPGTWASRASSINFNPANVRIEGKPTCVTWYMQTTPYRWRRRNIALHEPHQGCAHIKSNVMPSHISRADASPRLSYFLLDARHTRLEEKVCIDKFMATPKHSRLIVDEDLQHSKTRIADE